MNASELTSKSLTYTLVLVNGVGGDWLHAVLAGWMAAGQAAKGRGRPKAEIQRVKANDCFAAKSGSRDSAPPPPRLVAAFDRTAQIASDEFSVIKQLPCESCILESAEHGLQALTDSYALNGRVRQRLAREHRRTRRPI